MRSVHKMSVERRRGSQPAGQPTGTVKQEVPAPPLSAALDPSSEAESMSTVANSVAASLSLAVDSEYMALPDGIVPVEDENGMISYIALRPADGTGGGGAAVSEGAVLEMTEYTVPVVVSSAAETVTIQVAPAADGGGPGASAGETVLPDLAAPAPRPQPLTQTIDLPQTTEPQIARTMMSLPHLQTTGRARSHSGSPRGERRRLAAAGPNLGSSRISVSSSEVTVSDMDEPASILPHLPGEPLPAAVSEHYGQTVSLAQLQHGQIVMADGMSAGHVIVSELASGQEVIVADMAHGQLFELQQPAAGQQLIAQPVQVTGLGHRRLDAPQQQTELAQVPEHSVSQPQHVTRRVACDAQHRQELLVADISQPDEFIGPDSLPEDADLSEVPSVRETRSSETREHDDSGSGPPVTDTADMSVQQYDHQQPDSSEADISAPELHSALDESVAHYPPDERSVVSYEEMDSERDESVSHYPSGEVTVASGKLSSDFKDESTPSEDSEAVVSGDREVVVSGNGEAAVSGAASGVVSEDGEAVVSGDGEAAVSGDGEAAVSGAASGVVSGDGEATVSGDGEVVVSGNGEAAVSGAASGVVSGDGEATVSGDGEAAVSEDREVAVTEDREAAVSRDGEAAVSGAPVSQSPERPQRQSSATDDGSQLVLALEEDEEDEEAVDAVVVQSIATSPQGGEVLVETAPDPGDAWHEVLPPADGTAPRQHLQ